MILIIFFLIFFQLFSTKNLVFPFKKFTIEYLNKIKTKSEYIDFNIYTNITMGAPSKNMAHFITKNDQLFYYNNLQLYSYGNKDFENIQNKIENSINIFYSTDNSFSFEEIDMYYGLYSDIYYLYDLTKREIIKKLIYNMNPNDKKSKLYGAIDLYYFRENPDVEYNKYFFKILKDLNIIDDAYFAFI